MGGDFAEYANKLTKAREAGKPSVRVAIKHDEVGKYTFTAHYNEDNKFITGCIRSHKGVFMHRLLSFMP